ncbi:MAG TPA: TIGR03808 family TAT-translocated repetitive protein [Afipia sp.]
MDISRRHLMNATAAGAAASTLTAASSAHAAPLMSSLGRDATQYGVRPNSPDDQTKALQRAIDGAANAQIPLALPPGVYRTGPLNLPNGGQLVGVRGATTLKFTGGSSLIASEGASSLSLANLTLDGDGIRLPDRRGLVHFLSGLDVRIQNCDIVGSGGNGIWFENIAGEVSGNIIRRTANTALTSFDALGLVVAQNTIQDTSDNGIEILRNTLGDDGSIVVNNRIEDIKAGPGGSGQYGNAINAFRAGNVVITGNRIRNCDFSGVRGNSASNIIISGNSISNVREVALYSEFSFEGAVIANNIVDTCVTGISVCNFNEGGRIAAVHGNIIRNVLPKPPAGNSPEDENSFGIYVEADTTVTGNVVENAKLFGIVAGWGRYLRDVAVTGNVVRNSGVGIGVSVMPGAGTALVNSNMISGSSRASIAGLDHSKIVTNDLGANGTSGFAQIVLGNNAVR